MKQAIIFAGAIALLACTLSDAKELKRIDEPKARSLIVKHIERAHIKPSDWHITLTPFGKSTWLISTSMGRLPGSSHYVMNFRGEIKDLSLDSLTVAFKDEYPTSPKEEDRKKVIEVFVRIHSRGSIIKGTSDIPGYDKAPLDPDLAETVRAPFSFGKGVSVVYTYRQVGGVVRRYRFKFSSDGRLEDRVRCAVLGRGIGDHLCLQ